MYTSIHSYHSSSASSLNPIRVGCLSVKGQAGTKLMTIAVDRLDRAEHITHAVVKRGNSGNVTGTQGESLLAVHPSPNIPWHKMYFSPKKQLKKTYFETQPRLLCLGHNCVSICQIETRTCVRCVKKNKMFFVSQSLKVSFFF